MEIRGWSVWESAFVRGIAGAIVGGLLIFATLHVYIDHQTLHALVRCVNERCWDQLPPVAKPGAKPAPTPPPASQTPPS